MRTDQWLILGVAGLGAYAVYRLVTTKSNQLPPGPDGTLRPVLPDYPILDPSLPERPGAITLPADAVASFGPAYALDNQRWYGGRIESTIATQGPFSPAASRSQIQQALTDLGFAGSAVRPDAPEAAGLPLTVQVYMTPAEAQGHVPDYAIANAGRGTRWFYARWAQPNATITMTPVAALWSSVPPQPMTVAGWGRPRFTRAY